MSLDRPIDNSRRKAAARLNPDQRAEFGQFMTPSGIADFMASLFMKWPKNVTLLDPGAGVGSLSEAFAEQFIKKAAPSSLLKVSAFELETLLIGYLEEHLLALEAKIAGAGHRFRSEVVKRDFIRDAAFASGFGASQYTHVIMNPPYKKINSDSEYRKLLRLIGVETGNLYTAFLALGVALTQTGGEIVAIVPRSFCNGVYFRPFRKWLLERAALTHIHVFESRKGAFKEDSVLQENIIIHLERGASQKSVTISDSHDPSFADYQERSLPFAEIVKPGDPERFIHIPTLDCIGHAPLFAHGLSELGLDVATGPVVDFRLRDHCRAMPVHNTVPLLYAHHFSGGKFQWPREHKKPNAILVNEITKKWLMPGGWYTITRRFSAKEERRRVVAYVMDPTNLPYEFYGFENHLNVIHSGKRGIDPDLARGLAVFLNSTLLDEYFRTFSGHTQVNATDLRSMKFPSEQTLLRFGKWANTQSELTQIQIDRFVESSNDN